MTNSRLRTLALDRLRELFTAPRAQLRRFRDPRAEIIAQPPIRSAEFDPGRVMYRHQQLGEMAALALERAPEAGPEREHLKNIRAFHLAHARRLGSQLDKSES